MREIFNLQTLTAVATLEAGVQSLGVLLPHPFGGVGTRGSRKNDRLVAIHEHAVVNMGVDGTGWTCHGLIPRP